MNRSRMFLLTVVALPLVAVHQAFAQQRQELPQRPGMWRADTLRAGDLAPDFKLKTKDGTREVKLSTFRGKKPVVLIFGSFT